MDFPAAFNWPRLGSGAGLRKEHVSDILKGNVKLSWLEIITENFLDSQGFPKRNLLKLRQDYPIVAHGVSLSIASVDPLDWGYLKKLKVFYKELQPALVSDHLCWTGVDHENLHQLLPLPRTEETVRHLVDRIRQVQDFLGQRMLFENISTYLDFSASKFSEVEFLNAIADESDCGLLLDITNVYLNAQNHGYQAEEFLRTLSKKPIGQFHLSGHIDQGRYLFDSHSRPVADPVWDLYRLCLQLFGPLPTLIEWDADMPEFAILEQEVIRARAIEEEIYGSQNGFEKHSASFQEARY